MGLPPELNGPCREKDRWREEIDGVGRCGRLMVASVVQNCHKTTCLRQWIITFSLFVLVVPEMITAEMMPPSPVRLQKQRPPGANMHTRGAIATRGN